MAKGFQSIKRSTSPNVESSKYPANVGSPLCLLYDLEPTQRYDEIFSAIEINPILNVVAKKSHLGRSVELTCPAMVQALVVWIVER